MNLAWGTCGSDKSWCGFLTLNINHENFVLKEGVYIIWQKNGPIIKVGKGRIRDKLLNDRNNQELQRYENLLITWAVVESRYRAGVEKYLVNRLSPRFSDASADAVPITVDNLPWPY